MSGQKIVFNFQSWLKILRADEWRNYAACTEACLECQTRKWCIVSRPIENINISSVFLWIRQSRPPKPVLFSGGRWARTEQRCGFSRRRCCWPVHYGCPSGPTRSSFCRGGRGTVAGVDSPVSLDIADPVRLGPGLCSPLRLAKFQVCVDHFGPFKSESV